MKKKKLNYQKVVIPKGMINPNETTIIEIPALLKTTPILIAKKKCGSSSVRSVDTSTAASSSYKNNSNKPIATSSPKPLKSPRAIKAPIPLEVQIDIEDSEDNEENEDNKSGQKSAKDSMVHINVEGEDLDTTEYKEKKILEKRLSDFQKARRKLLEKASIVDEVDDDDQLFACFKNCASSTRNFDCLEDDQLFACLRNCPTSTRNFGCSADRSSKSLLDRRICESQCNCRDCQKRIEEQEELLNDYWTANCSSQCHSAPPEHIKRQCCSSTNTRSVYVGCKSQLCQQSTSSSSAKSQTKSQKVLCKSLCTAKKVFHDPFGFSLK